MRNQLGVALMYHALSEPGQHPSGQDPEYTLLTRMFDRQLHRVRQVAGGGGSVRDWLLGTHQHPVLLTFDDGHISNRQLALALLLRHGMTADFFINPANVGTPGFASWHDLREMAQAGMSIQSHGERHIYLTDLSSAELQRSLRASRERIEDEIGMPVTLLAPPGGRMPHHLGRVAQECGFHYVLSSRPGALSNQIDTILPRMAVTASLDETRFDAWVAGNAAALRRDRLRYAGLATLKRVMGNTSYEWARARALSVLRGTP
ncbi:MAG: polysaccharide deacetylase family protein [Pseudoxanthomonas sp.]